MIPANLQSVLRRGGVLHGPRLIFAALAVFILIFYFSSSGPSSSADVSRHPVPASDSSYGEHDIIQEATEELEREKDNDSFSDRFFEYVGHLKSPPKKPVTTTSSVAPTAAPTSGGTILTTGKDSVCNALSKASNDVLVVVNAPANELYSQLSSRLLSHLRCAPVVIFSTVSQNLGGHVVHDALASVSEGIKTKHSSAFQLYNQQHEAQQVFQDLSSLAVGIYELEKWTVIPALVEAYKMHPEKKFFALITPSTYLSLPNLLAWLPSLSPSTPLYAGAQQAIENIECASIKSGILLSRAAVAALASTYGERKAAWEESAASYVTADVVLAEALKEVRVPLTRAYPYFQGDNMLNIEWNQDIWCKAPIAWGSMTPALMEMVWDFERNWTSDHMTSLLPPGPKPTSTSTKGWFGKRAEATATGSPTATPTAKSAFPPYHYSTLLNKILYPLLTATPSRSGWDNGANKYIIDDKTRTSSFAHASLKGCRAACDIRHCVQFTWEMNKCVLGVNVRLGNPSAGKESGWVMARVKEYMADLSCPKGEDEEDGEDASFATPVEVEDIASVTAPSNFEETSTPPEPIELNDDELEDVSPPSEEKTETTSVEDGNPVDVEEGIITDPSVS
jgi:hypothetical protein